MEKFCCDNAEIAKDHLPSENQLVDLADFFKIFGDCTRIKLLFALKEGALCVCDLSTILNMQQPAVSYQLKILRHYKLVKAKKEGRNTFYSLDDDHILQILETGLMHFQHTHAKRK